MSNMQSFDDDEYVVPLVDQRVFGAGLKRKRVAFVPASSTQILTDKPAPQSAGSRYLGIVLKKDTSGADGTAEQNPTIDTSTALPLQSETASSTCEICRQPLVNAQNHDRSIAHQVCLEHSHPPSHLDRTRKGLKWLEEQGWDPDSRSGLGSRAEGIRIPIKAKAKHDTAGLREHHEENEKVQKRKKAAQMREEEVVKLDAKKVRKMEQDKGKHMEKLRRSIYGDDLSHYLGPCG